MEGIHSYLESRFGISVAPSDLVLAAQLLAAIPLGALFSTIRSAHSKQLFSLTVGTIMMVAACGIHAMHSLACILMTVLFLFATPRFCHAMTFLFNMAYLTCFIQPNAPFNAGNLTSPTQVAHIILALKLIALGFRVHDRYAAHKSMVKTTQTTPSSSTSLKPKQPGCDLSLLDIFSYCYCFCGLFTGPVFEFDAFRLSLVHRPNRKNCLWILALRRLLWFVLCFSCFIELNARFPVRSLGSREYLAYPFLYRTLFACLSLTGIRHRFYIAWLLAESACLLAGIGVEHSEPTFVAEEETQSPKLIPYSVPMTYELDESVINVDIFGVEKGLSPSKMIRCWNMSVQRWLVLYIYKRVPFNNRVLRQLATFGFSSIWHGLYPGYYLFFLTLPLVFRIEHLLDRAASRLPLFKALWWLYRLIGFCLSHLTIYYFGLGFVMLTWQKTFVMWRSLYFFGHGLLLALTFMEFIC
jgi:accessory gene regulator protein AgrB